MRVDTRREREIQELKNLIIKHSWKIIKEEGWQSLSLRKIADAIEYSVPVIYKHFENKEAILQHFSKEGYELLYKKLKADLGKLTLGSIQLRSIANSYWEFAANNTQHYRIMFGLGIPNCQTINSSEEMSKTSKLILTAITSTLIEANNASADIHLKLRTFWSIVHGFIAIELLSNHNLSSQPSACMVDAIEGFIYTLEHKN